MLRPRTQTALNTVQLTELWQQPGSVAERDLFFGPGGRALAPGPSAAYAFVKHKSAGKNPGYDVRDPEGRLWAVKLGEEAQSEVVASRILWAIGFHQPPTYYLDRWTLSGENASTQEDAGTQPEGRFRLESEDTPVVDEWSWYDNAFIGTRPFGGLIVAQLILNNWDLKTSNNKIYQVRDNNGATRRAHVVRDLGAALGLAKQFPLYKRLGIRDKQGSKNDLAGFEEQEFIEQVDGDDIEFGYYGIDSPLVDSVRPADVRWTCELLAQITDSQWQDAFRAGGYSAEERERYIHKIKAKIAQGLPLSSSM